MIPSLTGLRLFLAAMVLVYHYTHIQPMAAPPWLLNIVGNGFAAVSGFFVLSGFVLARNYITTDGEMRGTLREFWAARFARVYPVYFLSILLVVPSYLQLSHSPAQLALDTVATLTGIQAWFPRTALAFHSAAWSLSVEGFLYVCFPALLPLVRGATARRLALIGAACALMSLAPPALFQFLPGSDADLQSADLQSFVRYNPLFHLPAFLAGIAAERLSHRIAMPGWMVWPALGSILCVLAIGTRIPYAFLNDGLLIVPFSALILGLAGGESLLGTLLSNRLIVRGGEASCSLYLLHLPLASSIFTLNDGLLHLSPSSWLFVGISFAWCLTVSLVAFRFVEEPYRHSLKTRLAWSFRSAV